MKLKRFRLIFVSCFIAISLLSSGTAYAQEEEVQLPKPGLTPDSPFYFLDTWNKKLSLFLTIGAEAKAKRVNG